MLLAPASPQDPEAAGDDQPDAIPGRYRDVSPRARLLADRSNVDPEDGAVVRRRRSRQRNNADSRSARRLQFEERSPKRAKTARSATAAAPINLVPAASSGRNRRPSAAMVDDSPESDFEDEDEDEGAGSGFGARVQPQPAAAGADQPPMHNWSAAPAEPPHAAQPLPPPPPPRLTTHYSSGRNVVIVGNPAQSGLARVRVAPSKRDPRGAIRQKRGPLVGASSLLLQESQGRIVNRRAPSAGQGRDQ